MERLKGKTLREKLRHGPLTDEESFQYALQILDGLSHAHEKGIIHRDLKPENIFITEENCAKILDFGLARFSGWNKSYVDEQNADADARVTEPGLLVGTIAYMAPEQIRGEQMDHRCDLFSFGAVLYEMLCGQRAFERPLLIDTLNAVMEEEPLASGSVAAPFQQVLEKCLRKNPNERYSSARELNEMLLQMKRA
jgi:serine/threonine protein kinase